MLASGRRLKTSYLALAATTAARISCCLCQLQAGVYDFGQGRQGEKRGSWTPGEWLAAILLVMTIVLGLSLAIGLCYYVNKRQRRTTTTTTTTVPNYRRQQNLDISLRQPVGGGGGKSDPKFVALPVSSGPATTQMPIRNDNTRQQRTPNDSLIVQI